MGLFILQGYWESLLQQLKAYIARARLKERHQKKLRRKLDELKNQVNGVAFILEKKILSLFLSVRGLAIEHTRL